LSVYYLSRLNVLIEVDLSMLILRLIPRLFSPLLFNPYWVTKILLSRLHRMTNHRIESLFFVILVTHRSLWILIRLLLRTFSFESSVVWVLLILPVESMSECVESLVPEMVEIRDLVRLVVIKSLILVFTLINSLHVHSSEISILRSISSRSILCLGVSKRYLG
jgi:hypothetical protein